MTELVRALGATRRAARRVGAPALRLSVSARRRGHPADGRRARSCLTSTCRSSTRIPTCCKRMKRPASGEKNLERLARWREICPRARRSAAPSSPAFRARPKRSSSTCSTSCARRSIDRVGCFAYSPVEGASANELPGMLPDEVREERRARFMARGRGGRRRRSCSERVGATMQVLVDSAPGARPEGRRRPQLRRRAGDRRQGAPAAARQGVEDAEGGRVHAGARSSAADGHDLVGVPI